MSADIMQDLMYLNSVIAINKAYRFNNFYILADCQLTVYQKGNEEIERNLRRRRFNEYRNEYRDTKV